jgi:hypothetical protein
VLFEHRLPTVLVDELGDHHAAGVNEADRDQPRNGAADREPASSSISRG